MRDWGGMQVKPLGGLTRRLRIVFLIYLGIAVLGVAASLSVVAEYSRLAPNADTNEVRGSDTFAMVVGSLQFLAALTVIVTFLVWLHRASRNLHLLSGRQMRFTPGWAVGWWFIPFANLVMPYKVVRESGRSSTVRSRLAMYS